jgi:serpin B
MFEMSRLIKRGMVAMSFMSLLPLGLPACDADGDAADTSPVDTEDPKGDYVLLKSSLPRDEAPSVSEADLSTLVLGNTAFAVDLYGALTSGNQDNLFYSPFSISIGLAMNFAGAKGNTESEMASVLHFDLPQADLHRGFNYLDLELAKRAAAANDEADNGFSLTLADSFWGQDGFSFLDSYLDVLSQNYGAPLRLVDFESAPDEARLAINKWASENTERKISDILSEDDIQSNTRAVLVNAVYFKAAWNLPFEPDATTEEDFTTLSGNIVPVQMMHQAEHFSYGEGEGCQAAALPYDGGQLDMVLLVPEAGAFESFEASLSADGLESILDHMSHFSQTWLTLSVPKFNIASRLPLQDVLPDMGMPSPFSETADFSGMSEESLRIRKVIHQADITVDEAGTEAAAATVIVDSNGNAEYRTMELNRPFLFLIRDIPTGTIVFMGRVADPSV